MRVGFVGLGVMGSAMAGHLAKGGHALALYDLASEVIDRIASRHEGALAARSPRAAESATLVFMCGGEPAALDRVRPLLELMGKHVFHLGPVGSGHAMKTVNNLATALTTLGTTEAMLIGKSYGLKPSVMLDVLNVSTGMSFMTQKRFGPQVVERRFDDAFKLELMLKDVGIANRLADEQGLAVPVSALGEQLWRAAHATLGPGASIVDVVRWYERATGVELTD